jgi:hypothetical protein
MVNKVVLEYLRTNRGNYNIGDLKKKVLASGYAQKDIDEAMVQLNKESKGSAPSVPATINKINKTNIDVNANVNKPVVEKPVEKAKVKVIGKGKVKKIKKKKSWVFWLIVIWVAILVLIGIGFVIWLFVK